MSKQWYPESKILAHSFAMTERFYYVYRITLVETDQFYIGYTGDISSRLSQHIQQIDSAEYATAGSVVQFYSVAAELLCKEFEKHIDRLKFIRKGLDIRAIAMCADEKYAKIIERMAINDNKDNPLCLNSK